MVTGSLSGGYAPRNHRCMQARGKWSYTCTSESDESIASLPEVLLQAAWAHVSEMGEYRLAAHTLA